MNENEKEKLESYIAMCKCCLLAEALKDCPVCLFNIGLAVEIKLSETRPRTLQIPLKIHELQTV